MKVVNVCWGTCCPFVMTCAKSDANAEPQPGCWTRHYYPQITGENCLDYQPFFRDEKKSRQNAPGSTI